MGDLFWGSSPGVAALVPIKGLSLEGLFFQMFRSVDQADVEKQQERAAPETGQVRESADNPAVGEPSCVSRKKTDCFMEEVLGTLASQVTLGGSPILAAKL